MRNAPPHGSHPPPSHAPSRRERVLPLAEAAAAVRDGATLGLSGFAYQNPPMAFVREIIRRGVRGLTLVSGPTAGIETELLIGAGCVRRLVAAGVALERVAGIGPAFRRRVEEGRLELWECDECIWYVALKAGAWDVPYLLWPGGAGSDLMALNPELGAEVIDGRTFVRVPAINPDVVVVHAAEADRFGNVRAARHAYLGRDFAERALAEACRGPVIATVETIVAQDASLQQPERTLLWNADVVHAPRGAHPGGVSGLYPPDLEHIVAYARAGRALLDGDESTYRDYLDAYVYDLPDHHGYLRRHVEHPARRERERRAVDAIG